MSAPSSVQPPAGFVHIKLVNQTGNEVHFRVKAETLMEKVKKAYADRRGLEGNALRFLFDGRRVKDGDTPNSMGMENEDIIEVYQEQLGG